MFDVLAAIKMPIFNFLILVTQPKNVTTNLVSVKSYNYKNVQQFVNIISRQTSQYLHISMLQFQMRKSVATRTHLSSF